METYTAMRQFADSWGLLGMMIFFLIAVGMMLLPGAREKASDAARIPFLDEEDETCCGTCDGTGPCARVTNLIAE
jgi:cytochrome c oxidase cbb3-type subunit 4